MLFQSNELSEAAREIFFAAPAGSISGNYEADLRLWHDHNIRWESLDS